MIRLEDLLPGVAKEYGAGTTAWVRRDKSENAIIVQAIVPDLVTPLQRRTIRVHPSVLEDRRVFHAYVDAMQEDVDAVHAERETRAWAFCDA